MYILYMAVSVLSGLFLQILPLVLPNYTCTIVQRIWFHTKNQRLRIISLTHIYFVLPSEFYQLDIRTYITGKRAIYFTSYETVYKLLSLSLSFLICKMGNVKVVVKIKSFHTCKTIRTMSGLQRMFNGHQLLYYWGGCYFLSHELALQFIVTGNDVVPLQGNNCWR